MDLPLVSFELRPKYLLVVGHGKRDNLISMVEASELIAKKIAETDSRYLLVDYRNLQINVHMTEAFNIVKRYESAQPELKKITIAAVFSGSGLEFGNYWKDIALKRGFFITIFQDMEIAEAWLLKETEK